MIGLSSRQYTPGGRILKSKTSGSGRTLKFLLDGIWPVVPAKMLSFRTPPNAYGKSIIANGRCLGCYWLGISMSAIADKIRHGVVCRGSQSWSAILVAQSRVLRRDERG